MQYCGGLEEENVTNTKSFKQMNLLKLFQLSLKKKSSALNSKVNLITNDCSQIYFRLLE